MGNDSACHRLSISSHPHLCVIRNLWQRFDSVAIVIVLFLLLLELLISPTKLLYVSPVWDTRCSFVCGTSDRRRLPWDNSAGDSPHLLSGKTGVPGIGWLTPLQELLYSLHCPLGLAIALGVMGAAGGVHKSVIGSKLGKLTYTVGRCH